MRSKMSAFSVLSSEIHFRSHGDETLLRVESVLRTLSTPNFSLSPFDTGVLLLGLEDSHV